ncbi:MAG TPA: ABC transporter permease [Anaerolineae bacterium]|nr:ABC transporter permease [Anaerolineae bacterium]
MYYHLQQLYQHRELLGAWTMRTIRARYKQSMVGGLWAILQPTANAIIFTIIFTQLVPINTEPIPYIVFSYTALIPWTLLATGITDMSNTLVENMGLITKIYFPREVLLMAQLLARLVDFAIATSILLVLIIIYRQQIDFDPIVFLAFPLILLIQLALMLGLGLIISSINVFYRDVKHLVTLGLQIWLYLSPIIYPVTRIPEQYHTLYFLNPMAGILEAYRAVWLYGQWPDSSSLLLSATISFFLLIFGYFFFKRVEINFADVV